MLTLPFGIVVEEDCFLNVPDYIRRVAGQNLDIDLVVVVVEGEEARTGTFAGLGFVAANHSRAHPKSAMHEVLLAVLNLGRVLGVRVAVGAQCQGCNVAAISGGRCFGEVS